MLLKSETPTLAEHWSEIRAIFACAQASSIYCSIASVSTDGLPNVTPVGTVFLRDDCSGFYFDTYTEHLAKNIQANGHVCVMAVNASKFYWLRSLLFGRFASPPGVRLYGAAGPLREAKPEELSLLQARIKSTRWLKGNRLLWSSLTHVRDLAFASFRPVAYPVMMERLWKQTHNPAYTDSPQNAKRA
ncbi:MAG: pyridoxamine 5'-phosphate oxidase family protein [Burkholderiales bacterium]|nr:MAG: pyridoxamine 5'-phosphate oxidase [Burkholderiales bacterium 21-58-4]